MSKTYVVPAIVYEARLQTRAGSPSPTFVDPFVGTDPELPGKPASVADPVYDGSVDPVRPPKPADGAGSGGNDGSIDPPRPPKARDGGN